jgi:hypothetical protein
VSHTLKSDHPYIPFGHGIAAISERLPSTPLRSATALQTEAEQCAANSPVNINIFDSSGLASWGVPCLLLFLFLVFLAPAAKAQVDQGTITGSVEDSSGAVLANAHVALTNADTGLVLERDTNSSERLR